ncbi:MAG: hypothetical protein ACOX2L_11100 [Anaerolineae bacterium]|nr:hypothetical protein [Chloroflexota bacterium]
MSDPCATPTVQVLTGPVGCGKSTTARLLVQRLALCGWRPALVDLDLVAALARQPVPLGDEDLWQRARRLAGTLLIGWCALGCDLAVVEGEFLHAGQLAALEAGLTLPHRLQFYTLDVRLLTCLARVAADPSPERRLSRDPLFLREVHARFAAARPWLAAQGPLLAADRPGAAELACTIAKRVGSP